MRPLQLSALGLMLILVVLLANCRPFAAQPTPAPLPTYTPQPTYTPVPTYTPLPTGTPFPTGTPTPLPTYTPYPTYTPVPTRTPQPTEAVEPTQPLPTRRPVTAAPTQAPPTEAPADPCAGIPASVNGSVEPLCGTLYAVFTLNVWGFDPHESVGFWVSSTHGPIAGTRGTYPVDSTGGVYGLEFVPAAVYITRPGLYAWVFESPTTGHQAVAYFKVIE